MFKMPARSWVGHFSPTLHMAQFLISMRPWPPRDNRMQTDPGGGEIEPLSLNVICMKNKIKIYSNHVTNFGRHGPHTKKEGNPTPNGRKFHFFSLLSGHIFRQKFSPSTGVGGHYPGQRLTMWVNWWSRSGNRNSKFFFILWFILILSIFTEEASSSSSGEKLFRSLGRN